MAETPDRAKPYELLHIERVLAPEDLGRQALYVVSLDRRRSTCRRTPRLRMLRERRGRRDTLARLYG
jgi:hypothetical protein